LRRWHSIARRHRKSGRLSHADRIRDLAKGLIDACEPDPALVGPLARDYECVAEAIALAIEAGGDPIIAIDPACFAVAAADRHATSDGVWALTPAAVEGYLKQITAAIGRLPDVVVEDADFGHYGSGYASYAEIFVTARDGSLRNERSNGTVEVQGMFLLLCRLAPLACLIPSCHRSRSANGSGASDLPSADAATRTTSQRWEQIAHQQITETLTLHGFSLLKPETLSRPISPDLIIDTNLAEPPYTVFDAWFHWMD
jgi:hypothetical protein